MKIYNPTGFSTNLTGSFSGSVKGTLTATGNIIPDVSGAYDIGSTEFPFKDLYITQNSLKFIDDSTGNEIGRISVNSNTGDIKLLNTKNLTEEQKATLTAENVGAEALSPVSASSLWVSQSIFAGHENTNIGHTAAPFHTLHTQFISASSTNITGDLNVGGTVTAQEFHTEFVSASIIYQSGSTKFGNSADDTHIFSGSIGIGVDSPNSTLEVNGNIYLSNTNSNFILFGTSSNVDAYVQSDSNQNIYLGNLNTSRLSVSSSGNVGIGTTNPTQKLHIQGDTNGDVGVLVTNNRDNNGTDDADAAAALIFQVASNNGYFRVHGAPTDLVSEHQIDIGSTANGSFLTFSPSQGVGGEKMRITSDGNIGIGTTSPDSMLTLNGTTPYIRLERSGVPTWEIRQNFPSTEYGFQIVNVTAGTIPLFVGNSNNVGIGTTSPSTPLTVNGVIRIIGTGSGNSQLDLPVSYGALRWYDGNTFNGGIGTVNWSGVGSGNDLTLYLVSGNFHVSDTNSSIITTFDRANRRVGIGTTSPRNTLQVEGNIEFGNWSTAGSRYIGYSRQDTGAFGTAGASGLEIESGNFGGTGNYDQKVHIWTHTYNGGSGRRLTVDNYGKVGIGTTSPDTQLHIGAAVNVAPKLRFELIDSGTSINASQEYGAIQWEGNDAQGNGVRAEIRVIGEGTSGQSYMTFGTLTSGYTSSTNALERMRVTAGGSIYHPTSGVGSYTSFIGTIAPNNSGNRYLHVRFSTTAGMMFWIKVLGYQYAGYTAEGLAGGYIYNPTGTLFAGVVSGIFSHAYHNISTGYAELVLDTQNGSTSNRWGSYTFMGGNDNIVTPRPLEIVSHVWTSSSAQYYT